MPNKITANHPMHRLWIILDQTYVATSKCQEAKVARVGLTLQQYRVLMVLDAAKHPVTLTDVARWLDRNTNSISLIVDRMEKVGLVKRIRDLKDRRAIRLAMTVKGKDLFRQASIHCLELLDTVKSCCTEEEMQILVSLLGKLRGRALEELAPEEGVRVDRIDVTRDIALQMSKPRKVKKGTG
ncbi:MAG: MarR family transcriptional regulator [Dehalococcoidales bacterium]|nr:MarR family transcriptional regulator [Dehalococcoidales bacterium]